MHMHTCPVRFFVDNAVGTEITAFITPCIWREFDAFLLFLLFCFG